MCLAWETPNPASFKVREFKDVSSVRHLLSSMRQPSPRRRCLCTQLWAAGWLGRTQRRARPSQG